MLATQQQLSRVMGMPNYTTHTYELVPYGESLRNTYEYMKYAV